MIRNDGKPTRDFHVRIVQVAQSAFGPERYVFKWAIVDISSYVYITHLDLLLLICLAILLGAQITCRCRS